VKLKTGSRLAWGLFLLFLVVFTSGMTLGFASNAPGVAGALPFAIAFSIFAAVGALVASRRPDSPIGWLLIPIGFGPALGFLGLGYARWALIQRPGSLPFGHAAAWITTWAFSPIFLILLVLLLFPSGRLPSPRWKPFAWMVGTLIAVSTVGSALVEGPIDRESLPGIENPIAVPEFRVVNNAALILTGLFFLICVASLFIRYRRASGDERQQMKWLAFGAVAAGIGLPLSDALPSPVADWVALAALVSLAAGISIAVLRFRLYDVDIVINKTVVYGLLAVFIAAVYLGIVVVLGAVFFGRRGNLALSIVATALIAAAFQPVRARTERLANRLVYGKSANPYEVLSEFSQRVIRYSADEVVPQVAELIRDATRAEAAEVWLRVGHQLELRGSSPEVLEETQRRIDLVGEGQPDIPGVTSTAPIDYQGELLGAIGIRTRRGRELDPRTQSLVRDFARQAALVLRNVRLLAELQASRQRLVSAQNEERRKLERDLHDGAQQQLVALKVQLGLAERIAAEEKVKTMLSQLQASTDETIDALRDLARGIYPPVLADQGLSAALNVQASKAQHQISISSDGIGRYPQAIEAAVYFCCLEAMQNAGKYAGGASVEIRLRRDNGSLVFEVEDEGPGFHPETVKRGSGLQNMTDRVEALGGKLSLVSSPGSGTLVRGEVPIPESQVAS
jgi:signal transduction histidine kinase